MSERQLALTWLRQDVYDCLTHNDRIKLLVDTGLDYGMANHASCCGAAFFWATFCLRRRFNDLQIDRTVWRTHATALQLIDTYLQRHAPPAPPTEPEVPCKPVESEDDCIICFSASRCVVLRPCNHLCACGSCALQLHQCPVCRALVADLLVVFKS